MPATDWEFLRPRHPAAGLSVRLASQQYCQNDRGEDRKHSRRRGDGGGSWVVCHLHLALSQPRWHQLQPAVAFS